MKGQSLPPSLGDRVTPPGAAHAADYRSQHFGARTVTNRGAIDSVQPALPYGPSAGAAARKLTAAELTLSADIRVWCNRCHIEIDRAAGGQSTPSAALRRVICQPVSRGWR